MTPVPDRGNVSPKKKKKESPKKTQPKFFKGSGVVKGHVVP